MRKIIYSLSMIFLLVISAVLMTSCKNNQIEFNECVYTIKYQYKAGGDMMGSGHSFIVLHIKSTHDSVHLSADDFSVGYYDSNNVYQRISDIKFTIYDPAQGPHDETNLYIDTYGEDFILNFVFGTLMDVQYVIAYQNNAKVIEIDR